MKEINLPIIIVIFLIVWGMLIGTYFSRKECNTKLHEYQVELEFDTVLIYQNGRYVDKYVITDTLSTFETILANDNR